MPKQTKITYSLPGLEKLSEGLAKTYRARVGILGNDAERKDESTGIDNATLGIIQIFGSVTKNIPPRDFLLFPIEVKQRELVNAMRSKMVLHAIQDGNYKKVFRLLGAAGVAIVLGAFETGGFGAWAPNAPATIARKKSDRPLIDTSQLRRAITSDVVKKGEI